MWGFLATVIVCATVIYWSQRYLEPYHKPEQEQGIEDFDYTKDDMAVFDDVIKEIYGRLDDDNE